MTAREYRFFRASNDDQEGWLLVGAPSSYYPLEAMGVAHDILEHSPDDQGSAIEEFMALGAALYIRGDGGYWSSHRYRPAFHIAGDITDVLGRSMLKYDDRIVNEESMAPVPRTRCGEPLSEDVAEEIAKYVRIELDMAEAPADIRKAVNHAVRGVKCGYRLAQKRYGKIRSEELTAAFQHIEGCVMALDLEHQEMKVIVDSQPRLGRIRVQVYDDFGDLVTPVERRWR